MVGLDFHVAKHEDGRRRGHIHRVYVIRMLAKWLKQPMVEIPYL